MDFRELSFFATYIYIDMTIIFDMSIDVTNVMRIYIAI